MIERFHAIVLRIVKHNDKIQIADVLTKEHGRLSFAIPAGSMTARKGSTRMVWRPLTMLEFDANIGAQKGLPRPKDVRVYAHYADIPYNPLKSMIAMFINEMLAGVLWSEQAEPSLYAFVEQSCMILDERNGAYANFPIAFAIQLLRFLGVQPSDDAFGTERFYDLLAAEYVDFVPAHDNYLRGEEAQAVKTILRMNYANMHRFRMNRRQRQRVLEIINDFYRIHVPDFRRMKSLEVFADALS